LTGSKDDAAYAEEIAAMTKSKPLVAAGRTSINELAALVKHLRAYVTPDSAPMHVACAMGVPCVALFGPTDPKRHVVPNENCTVISRIDDFECAPCYKPACQKRSSCMKKITVEDVMGSLRSYLGSKTAAQTEEVSA
jgi:ADP-heptose:LPS heptosyltransferase